ncbi:MAG: FHA domain-containing protein [Desulfobacterales bacterium]|nr:FHA domain-containing protein [Desulfobacterales bacterium]
MPKLILRFKGNTLNSYTLTKGESLTVGRRKDNTAVIQNLAVSGHHAKIDSVGDEWLVTDLKSKNGTFVNENVITSHWLQHGDIINIGKHTIVFGYMKGEARPGAPEEKVMDKTMAMDTGEHRAMLKKDGVENGGVKNAGVKKRSAIPLASLRFISGGEGSIELLKGITTIGKDPASDVSIGGMMVGQTAATISRRPTGYTLSYVGGMAKVKVNGKAIKRSVKLADSDDIEVGSATLKFLMKT